MVADRLLRRGLCRLRIPSLFYTMSSDRRKGAGELWVFLVFSDSAVLFFDTQKKRHPILEDFYEGLPFFITPLFSTTTLVGNNEKMGTTGSILKKEGSAIGG